MNPRNAAMRPLPGKTSPIAEARAHYAAGRVAEAERLCRRIIARETSCDALQILGGIALARGDAAAAVDMLSRAIAVDPANAACHANLGAALHAAGRFEAAAQALAKAVALAPDLPEAHFNFGNLLRDAGRLDAAAIAYARALKLRPDYIEALNNIAVTLWQDGRADKAVAYAELAVSLAPRTGRSLLLLGEALRHAGRHGDAMRALGQARSRGADPIAVARNLAGILLTQGDADGTAACVEAALADPHAGTPADRARLHSSLLFALNYGADRSAADIARHHRAWASAHHADHPAPAPFANEPDPERRLRIGYVSPDFVTHSVASFIAPVLAAHDRDQVEIHCFADVPRPDAVTLALRNRSDHWHDVAALDDAALTTLVRRDTIDILVDLAGHTADNRLGVFARRAAPVQVSWLGYPGSTGLPAIDYRLSDDVADPEGQADVLSTEKIVRLPQGFHCYQPPEDAPPPAPPPHLANGFVTFGSFNTFAKLSPVTLQLWAAVLDAVPGSRLVLKDNRLHDDVTAQRHRDRFAGAGIDPARLTILRRAPDTSAHLCAYAQIDIALDPFPYNGTTTTCEALHMGVPVITLAGDRHAARVGASLLHQVGLDDCVATRSADYLQLARTLAADHDRRQRLRGNLRGRLAASPLGDRSGFARRLETAYRTMWRRWCAVRP
ncbi:MAG: tetratricopeptide repeat protein [Alphaproteobacteria bacterium]|nr:tetratricopeptide repeat protein [Alphaproteobacteria bacterium]